jgi:hypothetical protein
MTEDPKMKKLLLGLALVVSVASAQQTVTKGQSAVITQLVDGDGWQTWITLSNVDNAQAQFIVNFFKDDGTPLQLTTDQTVTGNGTFVVGIIPANGSVVVKTPGTSPTLTQGWAKLLTVFTVPGGGIASGATIAGTALFRRPQTVSRPTEASESLDFSQAKQWALPFDHTNGYTTGLALVNQSLGTGTVSMTFYDQNGVVLLAVPTFDLLSGQHMTMVLTTAPGFSSVAGQQGTLIIKTTAPSINVLGMRTSPAGDVSGIAATTW